MGGIGTKARDIVMIPSYRKDHYALHADPVSFERQYDVLPVLIVKLLNWAYVLGVLVLYREEQNETRSMLTVHHAGLEIISAAPRKSWLDVFKPLNGIHSAWIKYLLTVWDEGLRRAETPVNPQSIHVGEL